MDSIEFKAQAIKLFFFDARISDTVGLGPQETTEYMSFREGKIILLPDRFKRDGKVKKFVFHVAKVTI